MMSQQQKMHSVLVDPVFITMPMPQHTIVFHAQLLTWFSQYGRHDLPWKPVAHRPLALNLYYVWLSEIMLQQTQVTTVLPYFARFINHFPNLTALAQSPLDPVLKVWEGLGYYSRAKNLHLTAQAILHTHQGVVPQNFAQLQQLKGIGRTTAAAILTQGYGRPFAIFDGNVKRVLARIYGCNADESALEHWLLPLANTLALLSHPQDYTQAIMDFGATVCRKKPLCAVCFFHEHCLAFNHQQVDKIPHRTPKKPLPKVERYFLVLINSAQEIFMEKRPANGIWPNLYSVPEWETRTELNNWLNEQALTPLKQEDLPHIQHRFTHYALAIKPIMVTLDHDATNLTNTAKQAFFVSQMKLKKLAIPKPISQLLYNNSQQLPLI